MAVKMKVKKGDLVQILSGKDRGKQGRVLEARPAERRVIVENLNLAKRHTRPKPIKDSSRMGGTQVVPGGIMEKPAAISVVQRHGRVPGVREPHARRRRRDGRQRRDGPRSRLQARGLRPGDRQVSTATAPAPETYVPRLKHRYEQEIRGRLKDELGLESIMQAPRVTKITLNMGVGEAKTDAKALDAAIDELTLIAGQRAQVRRAKKSIASFKLREGMPVGAKVTLRGSRMYEFLDRLASIALPRIRDFRGLDPEAFDGRGNYSIGIREQIIFPEIDYDQVPSIRGLDVAITTSATSDEHGRALLGALGLPFAGERRDS